MVSIKNQKSLYSLIWESADKKLKFVQVLMIFFDISTEALQWSILGPINSRFKQNPPSSPFEKKQLKVRI